MELLIFSQLIIDVQQIVLLSPKIFLLHFAYCNHFASLSRAKSWVNFRSGKMFSVFEEKMEIITLEQEIRDETNNDSIALTLFYYVVGPNRGKSFC